MRTTFRQRITATEIVEPLIGETYRFVGESVTSDPHNSRSHPFMIVALSGGGTLKFSSGDEYIGWLSLEGQSKGTVYRFHDNEEIEPEF